MGHEPTYVVTDQDASLRVAVPRVFTSARHRFCMWHIMTKVGDKVRAVLANDQPFRRDLNAIVWDECITIEQFESKWIQLMEVHGLGAIDTQRHKQAKLDVACEGYLPVVKTPLPIERYAASIYTITIFYDVQAEIVVGCFECRVFSVSMDGDVKRVEVEGANGVVCVVVFHMSETTASCSCRMFERVGLLCRHIFLVFKDAHVDSIPDCYIVSRWTRDAYKRPIYDIDGVHDEFAFRGNSRKGAMKEVWNDFYSCVALAGDNSDRVSELSRILRELKLSFVGADSTLGSSVGKSGVIRFFGGVLASSEIVVQPPTVAKNKGSWKRYKISKELAMEKAAQFTRECATCHKCNGHDSRNCPLNPKSKSNVQAKLKAKAKSKAKA
ncbi:protein FAR1-RELATED SEQUENCE 5-like [Ipomoea triloba]|uniref:protein FAR1-RELATED SEQUENCE 5-like n=1 Tax=Ipomoea triloba TaxID=35885 RepID=UPI00125D7ED2|nr:protein FAR1-RELATED SEQUENCE 5-like [Ipomoea triloba]